jgi:hypothetical protein
MSNVPGNAYGRRLTDCEYAGDPGVTHQLAPESQRVPVL